MAYRRPVSWSKQRGQQFLPNELRCTPYTRCPQMPASPSAILTEGAVPSDYTHFPLIVFSSLLFSVLT